MKKTIETITALNTH